MNLTRRRLLESWWVLPVAGTGGFFAWLGLRAYRIKFGKPTPGAPAFVPGKRVRVAGVDELGKVWASRDFEYPVKLGTTTAHTPAILVRTADPQPGGVSVGPVHLLALSRVCTHLGCVCDYITEPEVASIAYSYRPPDGQAVLGCACHHSAFDPERAGKSVSGPAIRPLPRLELEVRGGTVYAIGLEPT